VGSRAKPTAATTSSDTSAYSARLLATLRKATTGEYEIRGEIGRGGMAAVYLAYDLRLNRKVAIKVMLPELAFHEGMEDRFKREARTAAKLDHPHIVVIYSVRDDAELLFFVMKYIEGASLEQIARKYAPLPLAVVQHVLVQLGGALQFAHDEGVVHRDVKPANVLIDRRGNVLVTDFGIAKATESTQLTRTGSVIGTPAYMSPEQCLGTEQTHASDQYSLGVVAYEMIAGRPPFVGPSYELQWAHVKNPPPPLQTARPDCPPALAAAVMRMLAKEPTARWPSLEDAVPTFAAGLVPGDDSPRAQLAGFVKVVSPVRTDSIAVTPASPIPRGKGSAARSAPVTPPAPITPPAPVTPWTSIRISPAQPQLEVGDHVDLTVEFLPPPTAGVQTPNAVWTSSAPTIVTVSASGVATAIAVGSAVISAQAANLGASTTVAVRQSPVASIQLRPPARPIEVGTTHRMECTIRDARDRELAGREVFWASSTPRVASVNAAGEVTAHALGKSTIGADCESISATINIEVVPDRVAEVTLTPATLTLEERSSGRLTVRANNERGKAIGGRQVTLRSADPAIASVGPDGAVVAKAIGRTIVSATCDGQTGTAEVVVRPVAVATVAVRPQAPSVKAGDVVVFAAEARDASGHPLSGRAITWRSSDTRLLTVDQMGRAVATKAGPAEVTAECEGVRSSVPVVIAPPALVSFEITAPAKEVRAGKRVRLRTKARDTTGREFEPAAITWRSTNASVATAAADGTVAGVGVGEATIFAAVAGHEARTVLTVVAAPPARRMPIAVLVGGAVVVVAVVAVVLIAQLGGGDDVRPPAPNSAPNAASVSPAPAPQPAPPPAVQPQPATPTTAEPSATTTPSRSATVATLRVTSRNPLVIESGEASRVTLRALADDGTAVPSPRVRWSVGDASVASVSANGTVSGREAGRTSVTATSGDATARVEIVVNRASPATVSIAPRFPSVRVGDPTSLTTRVRDRSGNTLSSQIVWRSSNPGVATVDNAGTVRGVRQGEVTVSAVAGGATDSVRVTVTAPPTVVTNPPPVVTEQPASPPVRPPTTPSTANASTGADVDAALTSTAQLLGTRFARGQLGQLTATSQFSRLVRDDQPEAAGAPQIQRRSFADGRAEGDVALPLKWTNFAGSKRTGSVLLHVTLELRDGVWRATSARNLNNP
jgi:serine/threonine-protein kinase